MKHVKMFSIDNEERRPVFFMSLNNGDLCWLKNSIIYISTVCLLISYSKVLYEAA